MIEGRASWHVREAGDPSLPTVVFLHGAGVSGRMWTEHIGSLGGWHCLAPDLPGCGESNGIPWISMTEAAGEVARLIEERSPSGRANVIGLSVGGAVAHTLLARHPDVIDRALIDGASVLTSWANRALVLGIAAISPFLHTGPVIAALSRSVGGIPAADQAEIRRASRRAFWRSYSQALLLEAERGEIEAPCPTLLVAGEQESAVRRSNAALATLMPNAVARYVPGVGHGWLGRRFDLHVEMVRAWLTGQTLPSGLLPERARPEAVRQLTRQLGAPRRPTDSSDTPPEY